jgi:hypothetical protein
MEGSQRGPPGGLFELAKEGKKENGKGPIQRKGLRGLTISNIAVEVAPVSPGQGYFFSHTPPKWSRVPLSEYYNRT